eukprot:g2606.t1
MDLGPISLDQLGLGTRPSSGDEADEDDGAPIGLGDQDALFMGIEGGAPLGVEEQEALFAAMGMGLAAEQMGMDATTMNDDEWQQLLQAHTLLGSPTADAATLDRAQGDDLELAEGGEEAVTGAGAGAGDEGADSDEDVDHDAEVLLMQKRSVKRGSAAADDGDGDGHVDHGDTDGGANGGGDGGGGGSAYWTYLRSASDILQAYHAPVVGALERALPPSQQGYDWVRRYSLARHGASLKTFFQRVQVGVMVRFNGNIFGGFASAVWEVRAQYYGNGECFLFSFAERDSDGGGAPGGAAADDDDGLRIHRWTKKNNYFMLANEESIAMGGGGNFGLYLDCDLFAGTSGTCETFGSSPLTAPEDFQCTNVEVWGFVPSTQRPAEEAGSSAAGDSL